MKVRKVLFAMLLCAVVLPVQAQLFKGEAIAGFNLSQVDGDEVYGFSKLGANAGMGVMLPLRFKGREDTPWSLSMEMLWHQKGSYRKNYTNTNFCDTCPPEIPCDSTIKYRLDMHYVSLPIMLHYTDARSGWTFGAGVSYNRLFHLREIENGIETASALSASPYSLTDYSLVFDLRFRIYQRLKFNFRYEYSFVPIRIRTFYKPKFGQYDAEPWDRKQYHNILIFRLIYVFNEAADPADRREKP